MTQKPTPDKDVHTEVRPHDAATIATAKKAEAERKAADMLPETVSDDALDDLFNDMPV